MTNDLEPSHTSIFFKYFTLVIGPGLQADQPSLTDSLTGSHYN